MPCSADSYTIRVGSEFGKDAGKKVGKLAWGGRFEVEFEAGRGDRVAYGGGLEILYQVSQAIILHTK